MKFIGRLKDQELDIQGLSDNDHIKSSYRKFLNNFFEIFFTEIFSNDYDRENFPILKANSLGIYDNIHSSDIYIIFFTGKTNESVVEFHSIEDYRYGAPTLIRTMLDCEIMNGEVILGLQIIFSKLTDKSYVQEIVLDYINKHK